MHIKHRCALMAGLLGVQPLYAANLLNNPQFHTDVTQWSDVSAGVSGSISHNAVRGTPQPGSMQLTLTGTLFGSFEVRQCVNLTGGGPATFGLSMRVNTSVGIVGRYPSLRIYNTTACSGPTAGEVLTSNTQAAGDGFTRYTGATSLPATTRSAMLVVFVEFLSDPSSTQFWLDDMLLDASDTLFASGFE